LALKTGYRRPCSHRTRSIPAVTVVRLASNIPGMSCAGPRSMRFDLGGSRRESPSRWRPMCLTLCGSCTLAFIVPQRSSAVESTWRTSLKRLPGNLRPVPWGSGVIGMRRRGSSCPLGGAIIPIWAIQRLCAACDRAVLTTKRSAFALAEFVSDVQMSQSE